MQEKGTLKVVDIIGISDFLDGAEETNRKAKELAEGIEKITRILLDGEYMTYIEYKLFLQEDPITNIYITLCENIYNYELPEEFLGLIPLDVYIYTKEKVKNKLDEILKLTEKIIGFRK